jgi:hypothetical protein
MLLMVNMHLQLHVLHGGIPMVGVKARMCPLLRPCSCGSHLTFNGMDKARKIRLLGYVLCGLDHVQGHGDTQPQPDDHAEQDSGASAY